MYDLIIIGAGPAGMTAAVYAARKRMSVLVISRDIGGQAAVSGDVENYTGYQFITGPELAAKFEEHMRSFEIELKENEETLGLKKENNEICVLTNKATYQARSIIVASGKRSRELNVPGEKEFKNKGVSYCSICDAPLFSGKDVAVIGGGNSALDACLGLIKIASHIYVINITSELTGDKIMAEKVIASDKITVLNDSFVTEILGDKMVKAVKIKSGGVEKQIGVEGIFVEIGLVPNSDFTNILEKNKFGEIKVNFHNETNMPGIFAAGDVTDVPEKQIIIAAGEGSKAALSAFGYLAKRR